MKYEKDWEHINADVSRLRVPGGWIVMVRHHVLYGGKDISAATYPIFLEDEEYEWIFQQ